MKSLFLISLVFIFSCSSNTSGFKNLDFSEACDTSKTGLCYWDLSWGGKQAVRPEKSGTAQWLLITGKEENSVGFAEQTLLVPPSKSLQIITVSARMSAIDVKGRGAGLNLGIYDIADNLIFTKGMGYATANWMKGNSDWKEYNIKAVCPVGTAKIKLGAILYGKGQAKFDDYKVEFIEVEGRNASDLAIGYISAAADTIAKNSLYRDSIDIDSIKKTALTIAGPAKAYQDCHLAVEYMIESLRPAGDHHSFFMSPEEVKGWANTSDESANIQYANYKLIEDYGYINVPPFHGGNKKLMVAYADTLQKALKELDQKNIKGWIIDLRGNTGGNMEPMIVGLGPIFRGEGLGYLIDVNGKKESWHYQNGTYYWEDSPGISATNPYKLSSQKPIAVLIGPQTGSSGEIVLISFIGNPDTRTFGQPSWGLTTGNGNFDLRDSARMMIASTMMADRNGKIYHGRVEPDQLIIKNLNDKRDQAIRAAIYWFKSK